MTPDDERAAGVAIARELERLRKRSQHFNADDWNFIARSRACIMPAIFVRGLALASGLRPSLPAIFLAAK